MRGSPLKYLLDLNDSGIWGNDPTGEHDTVVLRSTDISLDGSWRIHDPAVRHVSGIDKVRKRLACGDIVVVKSSGSPEHLGKSAIVTEEVAAMGPCFANFVQRLRPSTSADSRYMWYVLNSKWAADEMASLGNTTTGLRNLNGTIIGSIRIPVTRISHQRAIADYLDIETGRIDALITKKRRMIELLEERREVVTLAGVSGELIRRSPSVRSSTPWMTRIPKHWGSPKIGYVASLGSGHTPSRSRPEWWIPEECTIPWITTGEVARLRSDRVELVHHTRERISQIGLANSSAGRSPCSHGIPMSHRLGRILRDHGNRYGYKPGLRYMDMRT